jgi:hypothetical protein
VLEARALLGVCALPVFDAREVASVEYGDEDVGVGAAQLLYNTWGGLSRGERPKHVRLQGCRRRFLVMRVPFGVLFTYHLKFREEQFTSLHHVCNDIAAIKVRAIDVLKVGHGSSSPRCTLANQSQHRSCTITGLYSQQPRRESFRKMR